MSKFLITRDLSGISGFGLQFTTRNQMIELEAGIEKTLITPNESKRYSVVFSPESGAKVWIGIGPSAITLPTTNFTATPAQLNPEVREVLAGTVLRFITSDTTAEVGVSFYELS